jgi:hypothetical protein
MDSNMPAKRAKRVETLIPGANDLGKDAAQSTRGETAGDIDRRVKKLARVGLTRFYALSTRKRVQELRDLFWSVGDSIEGTLENVPQWRTRPAGKDIKAVERLLKKFVGHDEEKLAATEKMWERFSSALKEFSDGKLLFDLDRSANGESDSDRPDLRSILKILLRGCPGRPQDAAKQKLFLEALNLKENSKLSYARIARKLIPEEYGENPQKATSRIKTGVARLKEIETKTP